MAAAVGRPPVVVVVGACVLRRRHVGLEFAVVVVVVVVGHDGGAVEGRRILWLSSLRCARSVRPPELLLLLWVGAAAVVALEEALEDVGAPAIARWLASFVFSGVAVAGSGPGAGWPQSMAELSSPTTSRSEACGGGGWRWRLWPQFVLGVGGGTPFRRACWPLYGR